MAVVIVDYGLCGASAVVPTNDQERKIAREVLAGLQAQPYQPLEALLLRQAIMFAIDSE